MAERIQHLVNTNYRYQILNRDARLKALESQINPHFLYNTLETVNWRAKALKDDTISNIVQSLAALLRATLSNEKSLVPLNYELNLVNNYITIQKIRFEERLLFRFYDSECTENLKNALVLPLTIQPLLENAIRYGMEDAIALRSRGRYTQVPEPTEEYIRLTRLEGIVLSVLCAVLLVVLLFAPK